MAEDTPRPGRLVVLASGNGSNLQALLDACASGRLAASVVAVLADRDAFALQRARAAGVPALHLDAAGHLRHGGSRDGYDARVADVVARHRPDLIVLAGWMRVLGPRFLEVHGARTINLHPALPGAFPGKDAIARAHAAMAAGSCDRTGVMVHHVVAEVDAGAPVVQREIVGVAGESLAQLTERVHAVEHEALIAAVALLLPTAIPAADAAYAAAPRGVALPPLDGIGIPA